MATGHIWAKFFYDRIQPVSFFIGYIKTITTIFYYMKEIVIGTLIIFNKVFDDNFYQIVGDCSDCSQNLKLFSK